MLSKLNTWFRIIRHISMVGPEMRRFNRNFEAFMRANGITVPVSESEERKQSSAPGPAVQSIPYDEQSAWLDDVRARQRRGEHIDPEEIRQAAEAVIAREERYDDDDR